MTLSAASAELYGYQAYRHPASVSTDLSDGEMVRLFLVEVHDSRYKFRQLLIELYTADDVRDLSQGQHHSHPQLQLTSECSDTRT